MNCCATFAVADSGSENHDMFCPSLPPPGWDREWTPEHARRNVEWVSNGGDPWDLGWMK